MVRRGRGERIPELDGFRVLMVGIVAWFHFWQQTWFMPNYPTPWLSFLGITDLTPSHIRWVGYIFVDMMVLLSAFCLTLPVARSMLLGEGMDDVCEKNMNKCWTVFSRLSLWLGL